MRCLPESLRDERREGDETGLVFLGQQPRVALHREAPRNVYCAGKYNDLQNAQTMTGEE